MHPTAPAMLCLFVTVALAAPADALHCNGNIITIGSGDETFYIDDRSDAAGEIDHWVYQEFNGIEGLQSGTPCSFIECGGTLGTHDWCEHPIPDWLIL